MPAAVRTAKGVTWDHARGIREQALWDEHSACAGSLVQEGVIILGGPIDSDDPLPDLADCRVLAAIRHAEGDEAAHRAAAEARCLPVDRPVFPHRALAAPGTGVTYGIPPRRDRAEASQPEDDEQ